MTFSKKLIITLAGVFFFAGQAFAHHSTKGIYEDYEIELKGTVKEWAFVNPHPYLTIEAKDENGEVHDWDVSFGGAAVVHLKRQGYTAATFKPGDVIIVHGNPAKKKGVYGVLIEGGKHPTWEDGTPVVKGGSLFE